MAGHALLAVKDDVDKTHEGLGGLVAVGVLSTKARKCLMPISPAGCGKSVTGLVLSQNMPDVRLLDSVTRAGLEPIQAWLDGYQGLVVIDDLGKIDTTYSRVSTITTFCELVYSHFIEKHSNQGHIEIRGFEGSAIMNCQPSVLRRVMVRPEWDATIQDKTLRYFHLIRPLQPMTKVPDVHIDWGLPLEDVQPPNLGKPAFGRLLSYALVQWSIARAQEHLSDLLRAAAALDGRKRITAADIAALERLLAPMVVERMVLIKESFEEGRDLNSNLLHVLTELASYGTFTIEDVTRDYKITGTTARALLQRERRWLSVSTNDGEKYTAADDVKPVLLQMGGRLERGAKRGRQTGTATIGLPDRTSGRQMGNSGRVAQARKRSARRRPDKGDRADRRRQGVGKTAKPGAAGKAP